MKGIKTNKNFSFGVYYIDNDGSRIFVLHRGTIAHAISVAEETLFYNEMIGREYLITMDDNDGDIMQELFYVSWDGEKFTQTAYSI